MKEIPSYGGEMCGRPVDSSCILRYEVYPERCTLLWILCRCVGTEPGCRGVFVDDVEVNWEMERKSWGSFGQEEWRKEATQQ